MKHLLFICAVVLSVFTVACGNSKEKAALKAVIVNDMNAMENEDIEAALNGLAASTPSELSAAREVYEALFEAYDLSYKLVSFKVISCDGDDAVVEVVQEVRKISGPAFQDSRTTIETKMKKTASGWKQAGSTVKKVETL